MVWTAVAIMLLSGAGGELTPAPIARIDYGPLSELSGLVASRRYPGVFWAHNDSGDVPRIFALRADGRVVWPDWENRRADAGIPAAPPETFQGVQIDTAANVDWEDIASDGDRLYLADVGNNGNARRDLGVYVVAEPNPYEIDRARPVTWWPVRYEDQDAFPPRQRHFDCEGVFVRRDRLYFVTKHRAPDGRMPETGANLYRMETRHPDRVNVLRKVDSSSDLGGWVTATDLSPDGRTLAVLTQAPVASVWLFTPKSGSDRFLRGAARRVILKGVRQAEAIAWDGADALLVGNEQRDLYRIPVSATEPVPTPAPMPQPRLATSARLGS